MTGTTVGIRDLKARLSHYLREVSAGATLVVTDRGRPIARVLPAAGGSLAERTEELIRAGLLAWSGCQLEPEVPRVPVRGEGTVADLLLEDRE